MDKIQGNQILGVSLMRIHNEMFVNIHLHLHKTVTTSVNNIQWCPLTDDAPDTAFKLEKKMGATKSYYLAIGKKAHLEKFAELLGIKGFNPFPLED